MKMIENNNEEIFAVIGRGGINFLVTLDYKKAKKFQDEIDGASMEHWINGKHLFTDN